MGYKRSKGEVSDLHDDLDNLKDDLANLREDFGELVRDFISAGRSRVGDVRRAMRGEVMGQVERLRSHQAEAASSIQRQFESHPLLTVGAAFGMGLVLGLMLRKSQ